MSDSINTKAENACPSCEKGVMVTEQYLVGNKKMSYQMCPRCRYKSNTVVVEDSKQ